MGASLKLFALNKLLLSLFRQWIHIKNCGWMCIAWHTLLFLFHSIVLALLPKMFDSWFTHIHLIFASAFSCRHLFIIASDFRCLSGYDLKLFFVFIFSISVTFCSAHRTTSSRRTWKRRRRRRRKSIQKSLLTLRKSKRRKKERNKDDEKKKTNPIYIDYAC